MDIPRQLPTPAPNSTRALLWGLCILVILAAGGIKLAKWYTGKALEEKIRRAEIVEKFTEKQKAQKAELNNAVSSGGDVAGQMDKMKQTMKETGDALGGDDKKASQVMVAVVNKVKMAVIRYRDAQTKFWSAGANDAKGFKNLDDIAKRRILLQEYRTANRDLKQKRAEVRGNMIAGFAAAGISEAFIQREVAAYDAHGKPVAADLAADLTDKISAAMSEEFDLLEKEFGNWTYTEKAEVEFSVAKIQQKYTELEKEVNSLVLEQQMAVEKAASE